MVIWSDQAKADLKAIHDLVEKTDALPHLGRVVTELNDENVRELPLYSYRIIYETKPDDIVVLVIHKRRDLTPDEIER